MALMYAVFFGSGFAALLYQTIWQRLLGLFGGSDVRSATIVVSAFMAGLGFGSLAGGHLADRLTARGRLLAFAGAEVAIALFALGSVPLYYDVLYLRLGPLALSPTAIGTLVFVASLWPTFFMGLSLPLLAKALTQSTRQSAERIGRLYGWNTVGAAVGAITTVWLIVRSMDFPSAMHLGAMVNLLCAGVALQMARMVRLPSEPALDPALAEGVGVSCAPQTFALPVWIALYALSGFIALSLEILWFRLLGVMLKSNSFTFATLLAVYLAGVGLGAVLGGPLANRTSRPTPVFLALQAGIAGYAALSLTLFTATVDGSPLTASLWKYLGNYEPIPLDMALHGLKAMLVGPSPITPQMRENAHLFIVLYVVLPLFLVGPPTLLMGMSFAFVQRAVQTDLGRLGRRVGWLQTANIAGSMLGASVTGLFLLSWMGSANTLRLLVVLGAIFLLLACRTAWPKRDRARSVASVASLILSLLVAWIAPSPARLWAAVHGVTSTSIIFAEDGSGLAVLKDEPRLPGSPTFVYSNGIGQSWLPYGGVGFGGVHTQLGALGALLHPNPRTIAVIGLGSGDTVFASGGRPETERIDCIEIVAPEIETLRALDKEQRYPALSQLLTDPRIRFTFTDGRTFLMRGGRYDIIEADALRATSAFAGNLYSYEYFLLLREHLNAGGLAVSWAPTPRTIDTFVKAFPHVLALGTTLLGSNEPIDYDRDAIRARLEQPFTSTYYRRGGVDIAASLESVLRGRFRVFGPDDDRTHIVDINSDLFPKDEYRASTSFWLEAPSEVRH